MIFGDRFISRLHNNFLDYISVSKLVKYFDLDKTTTAGRIENWLGQPILESSFQCFAQVVSLNFFEVTSGEIMISSNHS